MVLLVGQEYYVHVRGRAVFLGNYNWKLTSQAYFWWVGSDLRGF
jgi:hypothetical protein